MSTDFKDHWESTYKRKSVSGLGWYEKNPAPSLKLLQQCKLSRDDSIVDIGTGASTFIDSLVEAGFKNITAVDISKTAIKKLKDRLGREKASNIKWIIEDITKPEIIFNSGEFFLWHDRATLHFLTDSNDSSTYLSVLKKLLKKNGFAIISTFSLKGAPKCSGLNVRRYDQTSLAAFLGNEFELLDHFDFLYTMPNGDTRPYIYTLFQRR